MLLETVLGPIWVWLALAEPPSGREVAGGAVVILALSLHAAARLREPAGS
jgi:drug/metabolite transporter (DMT)-like permease